MSRRSVVAVVAAVAACLIAPAAGHAGTARIEEDLFCDEDVGCWPVASLEYEGVAGEDNTVVITRPSATRASVRDETAVVTPGDFCTRVDDHEVYCDVPDPAPEGHDSFTYGTVDLGNLDDELIFDGLDLVGHGGDGDDKITGDGAANRLYGEGGKDTLRGAGGDDFLDGGAGADTLDGGDATDTLSYATRPAGEPVGVTLDGLRNDGADPNRTGLSSSSEEGDRDVSIENVLGGAGPDRLRGGPTENILSGGGGDDRLDGGTGADVLDGGGAADTISYSARASDAPVAIRLDGLANDGADPNRDGASVLGEERDRDISIEHATGGAGHDRLYGSAEVNTLAGGPGLDRLDGGAGGDLLDGGTGSDTITYALRPAGHPVAVRLDGNRNDGSDPNRSGLSAAGEEGDRDVSIENALGGAGPDYLRAVLAGVNNLSGNGGDDRLYSRDGSATVDRLNCGSGADRFQADPSDATTYCDTPIP